MEQNGSAQAVTRRISERLAERIGHHTYDMWFGDTTRLQVEGSRVQVATNSRFVAEWIDGHFRDEITVAARETLGDLAEVDLRVAPDLFGGPVAVEAGTGNGARHRATTGSTRSASGRGVNGSAGSSSLRRLEDYVSGPSNQLAFPAAGPDLKHVPAQAEGKTAKTTFPTKFEPKKPKSRRGKAIAAFGAKDATQADKAPTVAGRDVMTVEAVKSTGVRPRLRTHSD